MGQREQRNIGRHGYLPSLYMGLTAMHEGERASGDRDWTERTKGRERESSVYGYRVIAPHYSGRGSPSKKARPVALSYHMAGRQSGDANYRRGHLRSRDVGRAQPNPLHWRSEGVRRG
jgi:hypothetical protein